MTDIPEDTGAVEQHRAYQNPATGSYTVPTRKDVKTGRFTNEPPQHGRMYIIMDDWEDWEDWVEVTTYGDMGRVFFNVATGERVFMPYEEVL